MAHFLEGCDNIFERDRQGELKDVRRIVWARNGWMTLESGRGRKGGIAVEKRDGGHM